MASKSVLLELAANEFISIAGPHKLTVSSFGTVFILSEVPGTNAPGTFKGTLSGPTGLYLTVDSAGILNITATSPGSDGIFTFHGSFQYGHSITLQAANGKYLVAEHEPGSGVGHHEVNAVWFDTSGTNLTLISPPAPPQPLRGRVNFINGNTLQGVRAVLRLGIPPGPVLETFSFSASPPSGESATSQTFAFLNPIAADAATPKVVTIEIDLSGGATEFLFRSGIVRSFPRSANGDIQPIDVVFLPNFSITETEIQRQIAEKLPIVDGHDTVNTVSLEIVKSVNRDNQIVDAWIASGTATDDRLRHDVFAVYNFSFTTPDTNSDPLSTDLIDIAPLNDPAVSISFNATDANIVADLVAQLGDLLEPLIAGQVQSKVMSAVESRITAAGQVFQGFTVPDNAVTWAGNISVSARESFQNVSLFPSTVTLTQIFVGGFNLVAEIQSQPPKSGGSCVIATAAFGSPYVYEVEILRRWRNEVLFRGKLSKFWHRVNTIYMRWGTPLARFIADKIAFRRAICIALIPFVALARRQLKRRYDQTESLHRPHDHP